MAELLDRDDRVVLIRKLQIRWRLPEQALDTEDVIARLVSDLIAALEPAWATPLESPDPDTNAVVFPNTATWWADALEARAAGRIGWYHEPVLASEPLLSLAEPAQKPLALAILRRLGQRTPSVLASSPVNAVSSLAHALGVVVPEVLIRADPKQAPAVSNVQPELAELIRRVLAESGRDASSSLVGLGALALRLARTPPRACLEAEALVFAEALAPTGFERSSIVLAPADSRRSPVTVIPTEPEHTPAAPSEAPEPNPVAAKVSHIESTCYAGLFYLATLLVELGTGEHLWMAGLPEGQLLAWAARGLVGNDPAVRWFGGTDVSMPEVSADQAAEVIAKGCTALAGALPRYRTDINVPPLELAVVDQGLIATFPHSVFPVCAAACHEPSELQEAVAVLSECWPGDLAVSPAWGWLRLRGKIRVQSEHRPRDCFRCEGPAPVARLAAVAIGTAATLFEWRVGVRQDSVAAFVKRYLQVRGRLEDTGDTLVVHLRATDVSFPVRRAGLDRDPGYVPWLERNVMLRFEGDEPEGDELPIVSDEDFD